MLKTRVRLPALTYGINKLISLANIREYQHMMYGYSHDGAEEATSSLKIQKVFMSERATKMISLPRLGHEHKPSIHRRQKQLSEGQRLLSQEPVHKTSLVTGEEGIEIPTFVV